MLVCARALSHTRQITAIQRTATRAHLLWKKHHRLSGLAQRHISPFTHSMALPIGPTQLGRNSAVAWGAFPFLSAHERNSLRNAGSLNAPAALTGKNRANAEGCSQRELHPFEGNLPTRGAGLDFLPVTGRLGGKHCANSEAPCGVAAAHRLRRLAAAVWGGPG